MVVNPVAVSRLLRMSGDVGADAMIVECRMVRADRGLRFSLFLLVKVKGKASDDDERPSESNDKGGRKRLHDPEGEVG